MIIAKNIFHKSYATVIVCVSTSMCSVIKNETTAHYQDRQATDLSRRMGSNCGIVSS